MEDLPDDIDEETPEREGKKISELHMTMQDFERYDLILRRIDETAVNVRMRDISSISPIKLYFSLLKELYLYFRPNLLTVQKEAFDERFKRIQDKISRMKVMITFDIFEDLELAHQDLLDMRQKLGMAVTMRHYRSEEKIKKNLLIGK